MEVYREKPISTSKGEIERGFSNQSLIRCDINAVAGSTVAYQLNKCVKYDEQKLNGYKVVRSIIFNDEMSKEFRLVESVHATTRICAMIPSHFLSSLHFSFSSRSPFSTIDFSIFHLKCHIPRAFSISYIIRRNQ